MDDIAAIYEKYFKYVKYYAVSLCFDELLAEEITQETFFKALGSIDTFNGECKIEVWLCRIAHNVFISMTRKKRNENIDDYLSLCAVTDFAGDIQNKETVSEILAVLMEIESPYKDVFYMKAFGELPYDIIAGVFKKSESWARVTYFRARQKIIERLDKKNE